MSNDLAVVLLPLMHRDPSEWSVGPRIPSEWSVKPRFPLEWSVGVSEALMLPVVSWRHQPLGPSDIGSPGSLPRLLTRRTRTSNTPRTTHVTGGLGLTAYTWPRGVLTSGNHEKETGDIPMVTLGIQSLSSGVAAVR